MGRTEPEREGTESSGSGKSSCKPTTNMADDSELMQQVEDTANNIRTMIGQKRASDAVMEALSDPPYATKNMEIKDKHAEAAFTAVVALKDSELDKLLEDIEASEMDTLMKFLYKFMAMSENWDKDDDRFKESPKVLKFHKKLVDKAGPGCIARVMASRKTL